MNVNVKKKKKKSHIFLSHSFVLKHYHKRQIVTDHFQAQISHISFKKVEGFDLEPTLNCRISLTLIQREEETYVHAK